MTDSRLAESLLLQKPYFGSAMHAFQGVSKRHAYMQALVELLSGEEHRWTLKIVEVGSWAGGSAITWARALKKYFGKGQVVCVDQWQPYFDTEINSAPIYGKMNKAAADGSIYRLFLHNIKSSGFGDIILPIIGNSQQILPTLNKEEFSIVYLDASHLYQDVTKDIRLSLALVEDGGFLCGDDLELQKNEVDAADLLQDVDTGKDYIRNKTRGIYYHPGVTMAVAEVLGEVSSWEGFWAVRKTPGGWTKVDLSRCEIEIPEHLLAVESESLKPVATYEGFNIVQMEAIYYGLRQSIGEVDLTVGQEAISKQYHEEDVFVGFSIDDIRTHIDQLKFSQRMMTALETVTANLTDSRAMLDVHDQRLHALNDLFQESNQNLETRITDVLMQQAALQAVENQRLNETLSARLVENQAQIDTSAKELQALKAMFQQWGERFEARLGALLTQQSVSHMAETKRLKEILSTKLIENQAQVDAQKEELRILSTILQKQNEVFEMQLANTVPQQVQPQAEEVKRIDGEIGMIKSTLPLRFAVWIKRLTMRR